MRVVISGGTGFIGRALISRLNTENHSLIVLTRNGQKAGILSGKSIEIREWDGRTLGDWARAVDGADAVVNLAGEPLDARRWTKRQKERIVASRVEATRAIVQAIDKASMKPAVLVSGSAVGYYGPVEEGEVTEEWKRGRGFLAETCEKWEAEAQMAVRLGVRVATLRTGVVLGDDGGALRKMILPFKLFVGGPLGSGRQWFPWIHRVDVVAAILLAIESLSGPINLAAPDTVTMREFCTALGKALHRPSWAPVPGFILRAILGEMSEMILTGQKVIPEKLLRHGYTFKFDSLDAALADIVERRNR